MRWRRFYRFKAMLAGGMLIAVLTSAGMVLYNNRFEVFPRSLHEIEPGGLYRGGRQAPRVLEGLIRKHGFRTIINLDDKVLDDDPAGPPKADSYLPEKNLAKTHGIGYFAFLWKGSGVGPFQEYDRVATLIAQAERPVFFHCSAGSKRVSAALAAYWIRFQGHTYDQAMERLRREYGLTLGDEGKLPLHLRSYFEYTKKTPLSAPAGLGGKSACMYPRAREISGNRFR
jgi:protein tyrosine phosphatase (PTP) superfamily phosphohydrolase (DUF442 family)